MPDFPVALLVTRNFPPLVGGMENVNQRILEALAEDWRVNLCGPTGCLKFAPSATLVRQSALRPLWRYLVAAAFAAGFLAMKMRPRLVLAGSGLTSPIAWLVARASGARFVVYLHGLDIVAPSVLYHYLWLPFIRRADVVLVNSSNTRKLGVSNGVLDSRIRMLHPGTTIPVLEKDAGSRFLRSKGLPDQKVLLSVGRLTRRKGLAEFVSESLPAILAAHPDVLLVVIGDDATDALHTPAGSEKRRIIANAKKAGVETAVRFVGRCSDAELADAYQAAHVHVFPVLESRNDVEGFGMVALEAAAHGLWTVAFAVGGVPDAVGEASGRLLPSGEYALLAEAITDRLSAPLLDSERSRVREFAKDKSWSAFGVRLRRLVKE